MTEAVNPAIGCRYFPPGPPPLPPATEITALWSIPNYSARCQRHSIVKNLSTVVAQPRPDHESSPRVRRPEICSTTTLVNKLCGRPPQYTHAPCNLTFDLLTLKVVSESRETWANSVPILVFLGLSVLRPDVRDRQTSYRQTSDAHHRLMPPTQGAGA